MRDQLLKVPEVAIRLRNSPSTVRRLIAEGHFKCCKIRGSLRVWESSVEDYLERVTSVWGIDNGFFDENDQ